MKRPPLRLLMATAIVTATIAGTGCQTQMTKPSGFLSTYSNLAKVNDSTWRYVNEQQLAACESFYIAPIQVLVNEYSGTTLTPEQKQQAAAQFRQVIDRKLLGHYRVVDQPGPDTGVLRAAITTAYKVGTSLGLGLEGEIINPKTGKQIAAVRTYQVGAPTGGGPMASEALDVSFIWWDRPDATMIMEQWADRLLEALNKAHRK